MKAEYVHHNIMYTAEFMRCIMAFIIICLHFITERRGRRRGRHAARLASPVSWSPSSASTSSCGTVTGDDDTDISGDEFRSTQAIKSTRRQTGQQRESAGAVAAINSQFL